MKVVREAAPAKLNLFLHLVGRRHDGFHEIESLFVFLDLADTLEARVREAGGEEGRGDRLRLCGPWGVELERLSDRHDNLVLRALAEFRSRIALIPPLDLTLVKRIPVAAGLGGGSADAAAALRIACRLAVDDVDRRALEDLAATLGADVPACLSSAPQRVGGIGEICRRVRLPGALEEAGVLLVNPRRPVNTAAVFRRFHEMAIGFRRPGGSSPWREEDGENAVVHLSHTTFNDLEKPACEEAPVVGEVLDEIRRPQLAARLARMSGSGGTCFALFGNREAARRAAGHVAERHPDWWVKDAGLVVSDMLALVGQSGD